MRYEFKACKVCGTNRFETYLSSRGLCESCARERAAAQVSKAYEVAQSLAEPKGEGALRGIERTMEYMTRIHAEAVERHAEVRAKRTRKTIAPSS